ncbi:hypothetical protein M8C21_024408 [Ambrosia artemisiifolia]|uniref:non-specific serine/threonine protein kinase n=1 Tax=Ambrosia artemisiifolia TaxID=4212 RepID=A0AAD5C1U8_AMBAR|nr:hypothetical protein M8C21_024408 [Ambrosia artemisiifolia]
MVIDTLMEGTRVTKTKLIFGFFVLHVSISCINAADTLSANQTIRYNESIISPQETFELGFFSPPNSKNHYVGIWYKKRAYKTVVWVANRDAPLTHTYGELTLTPMGILVLRDVSTGSSLWSSANLSTTLVRNPVGQLLDTGNFIIYKDVQENLIWQSFDFPTDTLLPEMKYGWNLVTRVETRLTSWKSKEDPASSNFSFGIDTRGYPQVMITEGSDVKLRGGPWNGLRYTGFPNMSPNSLYNYTFVLNQREIYYQSHLINTSVLTHIVLQPDGSLERLIWTDSKPEWTVYVGQLNDQCDEYALCRAFGRCNIGISPVCECLEGFEPRFPDQWRGADSSQGCKRTIPLDCGPGEGFNEYSNLKLPDSRGSWYNQSMTLAECEKMCKRNCSCTAYANSNSSGRGSGCVLWFGDLIDIRTFSENGDTLYIRMPYSELENMLTLTKCFGTNSAENKNNSSTSARISLREHQQGIPQNGFEHDPETRNGDEQLELPVFGLSTVLKATNNFSMNNKLGEGGFGPVYKEKFEKTIALLFRSTTSTSSNASTKSSSIVDFPLKSLREELPPAPLDLPASKSLTFSDSVTLCSVDLGISINTSSVDWFNICSFISTPGLGPLLLRFNGLSGSGDSQQKSLSSLKVPSATPTTIHEYQQLVFLLSLFAVPTLGVFEDGQEIAVKRLAQTSTQGLHEFKNEVISISKLQHRNLVKILGCCIERSEKMLIYEYMPNKGLDSFVFDNTKSKFLDWPTRYHIIIGIARGLLYLHQDSRLRIIHRDLKVSNILLDTNMNPKISDFGMARSFGGSQIEANTNRVVGTYGYMAPEYAGDGTFSIKSDAWGFHIEGRSVGLVAKCLGQSIDVPQVLRSIHVSLLCVQRHPEDRPTMTSVIQMLGSDGPLPSPKEPGFYVGGSTQGFYEGSYEASSKNELSLTMLSGR